MIYRCIRTFSLALALAGPLADAASAQSAAPILRENVIATSDVVRIGDFIENAGPVADIPIFRSPDLGTRGVVSTERIIEAIRPHQLIDIDTAGIAEVIVSRPSRAITAQEIAARIAQALSGQNELGEARNIAINFDNAVRTLQVELNATGELQVIGLRYDPHTTRFDVTFDLPSSAKLRREPARFTGTAIETVDAITVEHPVEQGEVLKASDLTIIRRPKSEGVGITDMSKVAGLTARRELRPGQPLRSADLRKPDIVQRGDSVTIVYAVPGLLLTLRGQAQDAGALGDSINVLNAQTKRVVQGTVSGPGRVNVGALTTRLVENTPGSAQNSNSAPPKRPE